MRELQLLEALSAVTASSETGNSHNPSQYEKSDYPSTKKSARSPDIAKQSTQDIQDALSELEVLSKIASLTGPSNHISDSPGRPVSRMHLSVTASSGSSEPKMSTSTTSTAVPSRHSSSAPETLQLKFSSTSSSSSRHQLPTSHPQKYFNEFRDGSESSAASSAMHSPRRKFSEFGQDSPLGDRRKFYGNMGQSERNSPRPDIFRAGHENSLQAAAHRRHSEPVISSVMANRSGTSKARTPELGHSPRAARHEELHGRRTQSTMAGRAGLGTPVEEGTSSFKLLRAVETCMYHIMMNPETSHKSPREFLSREDYSHSVKVRMRIQRRAWACVHKPCLGQKKIVAECARSVRRALCESSCDLYSASFFHRVKYVTIICCFRD
jgi:hypothetical protein